jgi:cytidine deaminase
MVLAAVETSHGVFGGSNVENVNFSLTKHAEEVAILAAIQAGAGPRGAWLETLYVAGAPPCGSCRQFASEFARATTLVLVDRMSQYKVRRASLPDLGDGSIEAWQLGDLLPGAFKPADLRRRK